MDDEGKKKKTLFGRLYRFGADSCPVKSPVYLFPHFPLVTQAELHHLV